MRVHVCLLGFALLLGPLACDFGSDSSCDVGEEGCECTAGGACDPGLSCRSMLCIRLGGNAAVTDGPTADVTATTDAGGYDTAKGGADGPGAASDAATADASSFPGTDGSTAAADAAAADSSTPAPIPDAGTSADVAADVAPAPVDALNRPPQYSCGEDYCVIDCGVDAGSLLSGKKAPSGFRAADFHLPPWFSDTPCFFTYADTAGGQKHAKLWYICPCSGTSYVEAAFQDRDLTTLPVDLSAELMPQSCASAAKPFCP